MDDFIDWVNSASDAFWSVVAAGPVAAVLNQPIGSFLASIVLALEIAAILVGAILALVLFFAILHVM